ncbi:MAG TPA: glycosyltransferase family 2 protein [Rudaea sp.]|nr:glycosyltransferase family 2 protein [Rudaea sp.]
MAWVFWVSIALLAYIFVGYALLVAVLARTRASATALTDATPPLTVVIAAYNEATRIAARVRDVLAQDYPPENLSVIVVSDGSDDGTDRAAAIGDARVRVLNLRENRGKATAINVAMEEVTSDVVVFTDARQKFAPNALRRLVGVLSDTRVGAVSGELEIVADFSESADQLTPAPIGLYWRLEKKLRDGEARIGWLHSVSGAIYAIRRELFVPLPPGTLLDDMWVPLHVVFAGRKVAMARDAVAFDTSSSNHGEEFRRKVRTLAGNWQLIARLPRLLVPWRNPVWFAWMSHKFLRLVAPWALIAAWLASAMATGNFYRIAFVVQTTAYVAALFALVAPRRAAKIPLVSAAGSFLMLNAAAWLALPASLALDARGLWKKH